MKSICIVIPYFGKWPKWFNIFLKTCNYNSTINWLFFTDCGEPKDRSRNIKFIKMNLEEFNSLASKKLNVKTNIKKPYKICDFKPAYGIIFEDYLKKYDFWGHGDIDVVYGNIRNFITDKMLTKYDIITTRKEFLAGQFTLFKNCNKINRIYKKSSNYKKIFQDQKHYAFDECGFIPNQLISGKSIFELKSEIESMTHIIKRLVNKGNIKVFFKTLIKDEVDLEKEKWKFYWNKGKLINIKEGKEALYFHFYRSKYKGDKKFLFLIPKIIQNSFFITKEGFYISRKYWIIKKIIYFFYFPINLLLRAQKKILRFISRSSILI